MAVTDSRGGGAIFTVDNLAPGRSDTGEVTLTNSGSLPGTMALSSFDLSDLPGRYGGSLSRVLRLRIIEVTPGTRRWIYAGTVDAMPELSLGHLAAGESNTYAFIITMPDEGAPASPYGGDNAYQAASTGLGYEWTLTSTISKAAPTISARASGSVPVGHHVYDAADLADGHNPTGAITFRAYGPGDVTCTAPPVFVSIPASVSGAGTYTSQAFTPGQPGTYRWIASYSGDEGNHPASGGCNDANQAVVVTPLPDGSAPGTRIKGHPRARIPTRRARVKATFRFASTEAGSTFRCKLDSRLFRRCASPTSYWLKPGGHLFAVKATDRAGNADRTPAKFRFRVIRRR